MVVWFRAYEIEVWDFVLGKVFKNLDGLGSYVG